MNKKQIIINNAVINMVLRLPISQAAKLHGVSRAYVSKLCSQAGVTVDRYTRAVTAPASTLKQLIF